MVASSRPTGQHTLRFPATPDGVTSASESLSRLLDDERVGGRARHNVELAFEEIGTNIVRHGRPRTRRSSPGPACSMKALTESVARARSQVDFLMVSCHQHWGVAEGGGQGVIPPQE